MTSSQQSNFGALKPWSTDADYNSLEFVINRLLMRVQTATPVRVISCTNADDVSPVGTVDVQILVNQIDGNGNAFPHGVLSNLPYLRMQGGTNAIILDPKPGDIGLACFASRDISLIKQTNGQANPGSYRHHDFADGVFVGAMLNAAPQQYIRFTDEGIEIISPQKITVRAPILAFEGNASFDGKLEITNVLGDTVDLTRHTHSTGTATLPPPVLES